MAKEYLPDKEKRLLLSAISREMKVCKEIDKEAGKEKLTPLVANLDYKFMYAVLFFTKATRREAK